MKRCLEEIYPNGWQNERPPSSNPPKITAPKNHKPLTSLPRMWKIQTAQSREEIYYLLISCRLFSEKQKGCHKDTRGTEDLQYIDRHILKESKTKKKFAMACIKHKKPYDMVLTSWIIHCFKMYKITHKIIHFIEETYKTGEGNWHFEENF